MKFLITGATGFVGSHIVEAVIHAGFSVVCPVRDPSSIGHLRDLPVQVIPWVDFEKALPDVGPFDYVIHGAAATRALNYNQYHVGNVQLTERLLRSFVATSHGQSLKRFVFISTQAVAGPSNCQEKPLDEDATPAPISPYGKTKLEAEKLVIEAGDTLPVTIIRPSTVFGPRDTDVLGVFRSVRWGIVPNISGPARYVSIIYVEDLTNGIIAALFSPQTLGKVYFMTNPEPVVWREFAFLIAGLTGHRAIGISVPVPCIFLVARVGNILSNITGSPLLLRTDKALEMTQEAWVCSPERAFTDFGWRAGTTLEDAVVKTAAWYRTHGWL
jgi:nucleoside-diphosphate-sugar epimerase